MVLRYEIGCDVILIILHHLYLVKKSNKVIKTVKF